VIAWRHAALLAFFFAASLLAQDKVTIEGVVLDTSTNQFISDAMGALWYVASFIQIDSVVTDASGAFRLSIHEAGSYAVEAGAPGFLIARSDRAGIEVNDASLDSSANARGPHGGLQRSAGVRL